MCVVAIAWEAHPKWRLIVVGNRDELHSRPTAPLAKWAGQSHVIAGRDLQAGGSWMGVADCGRFAVVTNIRDAAGPIADRQSRGELVSNWLTEATLPSTSERFSPFNLVVADRESIQFISNRPTPTRYELPSGIHGLSNAVPDEHWPRKDRLIAGVDDWLNGPAANPEILLEFLAEEVIPDRDLLPIFIRNAVYGTRCSTVVAVDDTGHGRIIERSFDKNGTNSGESGFTFDWS